MYHPYTRVVGVAPAAREVTGFVIGKGGRNIKRIQEDSGARSVVYERYQSQFVVTGTVSGVNRAVAMVEKCIADGLDHQARRREWCSGRSHPEHQTKYRPPPASAPESKTRLRTGFGALTDLSGMTMEDYQAKKETERHVAAVALEVERLRREKEDDELEASWVGGLAQKLKSEQDAKMLQAQKDLVERQKAYTGTPMMKADISGEVLTTSVGQKSKVKKMSAKGSCCETKGVNITSEILPSRTVDMNDLRSRNRAVAAKEKIAWQKRQNAWGKRNKTPKMTRSKLEEVSESAVTAEVRVFTPDDAANVESFLDNLPEGWGLAA